MIPWLDNGWICPFRVSNEKSRNSAQEQKLPLSSPVLESMCAGVQGFSVQGFSELRVQCELGFSVFSVFSVFRVSEFRVQCVQYSGFSVFRVFRAQPSQLSQSSGCRLRTVCEPLVHCRAGRLSKAGKCSGTQAEVPLRFFCLSCTLTHPFSCHHPCKAPCCPFCSWDGSRGWAELSTEHMGRKGLSREGSNGKLLWSTAKGKD